MTAFTFDVKLLATISVEAKSEEEARKMIRAEIDCVTANFGRWPDGSPIVGEASVDGELDLVED